MFWELTDTTREYCQLQMSGLITETQDTNKIVLCCDYREARRLLKANRTRPVWHSPVIHVGHGYETLTRQIYAPISLIQTKKLVI